MTVPPNLNDRDGTLLGDLLRVKVAFQMNAIRTVMGIPANDAGHADEFCTGDVSEPHSTTSNDRSNRDHG